MYLRIKQFRDNLGYQHLLLPIKTYIDGILKKWDHTIIDSKLQKGYNLDLFIKYSKWITHSPVKSRPSLRSSYNQMQISSLYTWIVLFFISSLSWTESLVELARYMRSKSSRGVLVHPMIWYNLQIHLSGWARILWVLLRFWFWLLVCNAFGVSDWVFWIQILRFAAI